MDPIAKYALPMNVAPVAEPKERVALIDQLAVALEQAKRLAYGRDIPTQRVLDHWDALLALHAARKRSRDM